MKGRILFLNSPKVSYSGKINNIDVVTSIHDACTIYDYSSFILDYRQFHFHLVSNTTTNILKTVSNGGILILLIQHELSDIDLEIGIIRCEKLGKTTYSKLISKRKNIREYFKLNFKRGPVISGNLGFIILSNQKHKLEPFMIHEITNKVFYGAIELGSGKVIFLPQLEFYSNNSVDLLVSIIKEFIGAEPLTYTKSPDWVEKYITDEEKQIDKNLIELEKNYRTEKTKLSDEKRKFLELNKLLYAQGEELEDAVKFAFELMGCKVEKTESGANIDLYITFKDMKIFTEVTGTVSKIDKGSKKLIQIMQGVQENRELKPLLIVNTYIDEEIGKRHKENFTKDAINFIQGSNPCCMTTVDLFYLLEKFMEGESEEKIIKSIHKTNGEFEISDFK